MWKKGDKKFSRRGFRRRLDDVFYLLGTFIQLFFRRFYDGLQGRHEIGRQGLQLELFFRLIGCQIRPSRNPQKESRTGNDPKGSADSIGQFVRFGIGQFCNHLIHDFNVSSRR